MYIHIHNIYIYTYIYTYISNIHTYCIYTYIPIFIFYIHTYIHTHIYICICLFCHGISAVSHRKKLGFDLCESAGSKKHCVGCCHGLWSTFFVDGISCNYPLSCFMSHMQLHSQF